MEEKYWQDSYEIDCPYCGYSQRTRPSIFHQMGMLDMGRGSCLKCGGAMRIVYNFSDDAMIAEKWEIDDGNDKELGD